jgi:3-methyladenine DNA glycosylase/8-oxoguanine DNA glycosylase
MLATMILFGIGLQSGQGVIKYGSLAFPTPEAIASTSFKTSAKAARAGYRSEYIHTLARRVAAGELDLEAL